MTGPHLAELGGALATRLGVPALTGTVLLTATALLMTIALVGIRLRPSDKPSLTRRWPRT